VPSILNQLFYYCELSSTFSASGWTYVENPESLENVEYWSSCVSGHAECSWWLYQSQHNILFIFDVL
jgi:hypothetical protein